MGKKKRIKYIDLCKGLGILMVTWGHITKLNNPVDTWAAAFKMAIFFVAAGYLICYADSYRTQTLKGYVIKLLKSLMIPYVLFSILSIGFRFATMIMKHKIDIAAIKSYILATITLRGTFALWFLPVLFIGEILFFCVIKFLPKWTRIFILILIPIFGIWMSYFMKDLNATMDPLTFERVSFLVLPMSKALIALWFLEIGHLGCRIFRKIESSGVRFGIGIAFTIANIYLSQINMGVDLNNMSLGIHPPLFFVTGILGSFGALFVFEFLENYIPFTILNYFGKNSLILMSTQRPFYIISMATAGWKIISGMPGVMAWRYYIDCLGAMILVLIIEYSVITFINTKAKILIGRF